MNTSFQLRVRPTHVSSFHSQDISISSILPTIRRLRAITVSRRTKPSSASKRSSARWKPSSPTRSAICVKSGAGTRESSVSRRWDSPSLEHWPWIRQEWNSPAISLSRRRSSRGRSSPRFGSERKLCSPDDSSSCSSKGSSVRVGPFSFVIILKLW